MQLGKLPVYQVELRPQLRLFVNRQAHSISKLQRASRSEDGAPEVRTRVRSACMICRPTGVAEVRCPVEPISGSARSGEAQLLPASGHAVVGGAAQRGRLRELLEVLVPLAGIDQHLRSVRPRLRRKLAG